MQFLCVFIALHGMQTQFRDKKAIRPSVSSSVCLSNAWIVTDGRTDERTDIILIIRPCLHSMQRGKNGYN